MRRTAVKTKKEHWRQPGAIVRLRVEDTDALRAIAKGRLLNDVLHEVLEAGIAATRLGLKERVVRLESDKVVIASYLKGRAPAILEQLEKDRLL